MITDYEKVREEIDKIEWGLITPHESQYLFNLVHTTPIDGTIVEIGSHTGKSSVSMGLACLDTKRKLYCIDLWNNDSIFKSWTENIKKFNLESVVIPIKGWSGEILSNWEKIHLSGIMIDMLFIDGSHGLADIAKDFSLSYHWVKFGGLIAFHDIGHPDYPGAIQFWDTIKGILSNQVRVNSIGSGRKILIN
jgi:predicted O-methyltransferase YrrM